MIDKILLLEETINYYLVNIFKINPISIDSNTVLLSFNNKTDFKFSFILDNENFSIDFPYKENNNLNKGYIIWSFLRNNNIEYYYTHKENDGTINSLVTSKIGIDFSFANYIKNHGKHGFSGKIFYSFKIFKKNGVNYDFTTTYHKDNKELIAIFDKYFDIYKNYFLNKTNNLIKNSIYKTY